MKYIYLCYVNAATDILSTKSRRQTIKGNPCLANSSTGGEKFSLPANQGFTVCWSEEGTSARWLAMRERTWLDMTSRAKRSSPEGPRRNGTRAKTTIAAAAIGAAMVTHHLGSTR